MIFYRKNLRFEGIQYFMTTIHLNATAIKLLNIGLHHANSDREIYFIPFFFQRPHDAPPEEFELIPIPETQQFWKEITSLTI